MQLMADDELHPALPAEAFSVVLQQTAQLVAGNRKSPGYRSSRALATGLLPAGDPSLCEATETSIAKFTLDQFRQYHQVTMQPDLTTIVIVSDVSPADTQAMVKKWFGAWKASGAKPETTLPPAPLSEASAVNVANAEKVRDSVRLAEELPMKRLDPDHYTLQLGNHVLGGGLYATRLYRDLREETGFVYTVDVALAASKSHARNEVAYE